MKTKLTKWYTQVAATFTCPHCNTSHNVDKDSFFPEMPCSLEDTVTCSVCKEIIEFDSEVTEYE